MVLSGNTFQDSSPSQFVFGTYLGGTDWTSFSTTVNASNNKWYNSATANAFRIPNGKTVNLTGWQNAIGSDYSSTWSPASASPPAACTAPTPSYADFSVSVDNGSYTMSSGKAVVNAIVRSFGYGPVSLRVSGLPKGVGASFTQQSLSSGAAAVTISSSMAAVAQTVPITLWATSGSRVHSVTFFVKVSPFATTQTTPTITWPTPAAITYGTPLSATQLAASLSVAGSCSYTPAAGTVLATGTQTLTATCTPADTVAYKTPAPATVSLSVRKTQLTITASSATVNHGDAVPTITPSFSGFVNGDTSTSLTTAPTCTTSYTPSSASGSTATTNCTGATSANYSMSYIAGTVTVSGTKQSQTITFTQPATPVTYGASGIPLAGSATSGLPVAFTGTAGVCSVSGNTVSMVGAGACSITASQSGNATYAAAQSVTRSIFVSGAALVITASSPMVSYGDPVPIIVPTFSGFVNGDNTASLTTAPTCTTSYTSTSPVGSTAPTSCSGAASGNYSIRYVPGTLSVSAAKPPQTITFPQLASPVTYGVSAIPLSATSSSGLPVFFTGTAGVCAVSGNRLNIVGAGTCNVTAIQNGNGNYAAAKPVTRSILVNPSTLVITASSPMVNYGDAVPVITPSFNGFVNGDNSASLTTGPSCTTSYTPTSPVGSTAPTSCSGAASGNYSIRYVAGTLSVSVAKPTQTITFAPPVTPLTYGESTISLSASSSSGLPVTFTATGVCAVFGNSLTIAGAGACTVTASQPGNTNYTAAPTVSRPITVNPASLVITASSPTVSYGDAVPIITAVFSGFVNGDSAGSLTSAPSCFTTYTPNSSPGSAPSTNCSGASSVNYSIFYVPGSVTINNSSKATPGTAAKPVFSLAAGTYTSAQVVTISDATPGATIYFTIDGTAPTTNSIQYFGPITVSETVTIEAIAVGSGSPSSVASATYTIATAPANSDFAVSASLSSLSLKAGESGNATIAVTPTNGFHAPVSFVCLGLPAGTTCTFSPSTVTPAGGATSTTLTLTTSVKKAELGSDSHTRFPTAVLSISLCLVGWKRRRIQMLLL